uniref:Uncharacterized protein n=1 Tax=Mola mola TaxID=94237 RepID=A0A3Q4AMT7_MOLML
MSPIRCSASALYASGCSKVLWRSLVHACVCLLMAISANLLHHDFIYSTYSLNVSVCACRTEDVISTSDQLLSTEEQVTLITESMTVTSNDQEKLLLLNKNTELRRVNGEVQHHLKLQQILHSFTFILLMWEIVRGMWALYLLLCLGLQSAKEYYEQTLMQELKKNQELQEYVRLLENISLTSLFKAAIYDPVSCPTNNPARGPNPSPSHAFEYSPSSCFPSASSSPEARRRGGQSSNTKMEAFGDSRQEMLNLKEQLEALRCQTQIYEAEYETEHNDHKHTLQENRRLRKKREEMRQQVALLQEQVLKVYEDDFRRERSDKQMLQRLLLKKTPPISKDPVLLHRCNNEQAPLGGDKRTQSGERTHRLDPQEPH